MSDEALISNMGREIDTLQGRLVQAESVSEAVERLFDQIAVFPSGAVVCGDRDALAKALNDLYSAWAEGRSAP